MYIEMPTTVQLYNTFRNRWCGAYLKSKGIRVIPTINWGTKESFDFCFAGVPKGSTVAVSTYMFHSHGNHADQKDLFMCGYREMLRQIEPEHIICYSEPFKEMGGNITYVDYDLSSWKHMADDVVKSNSIKHMIGYVMKGGGSAYGGKWVPKDEDDERLVGKPGEIKESIHNGYKVLTKIGKDGYAELERHFTDHNYPNQHTNPHDHKITWENNYPHFEKILYEDGVIPEFKNYFYLKTEANMNYHRSFESLAELKFCISCGAEINFEYNGHEYSIGKTMDNKYYIGSCFRKGEPEPGDELISSNEEDILNYSLGGKKLRECLNEIVVLDRTL